MSSAVIPFQNPITTDLNLDSEQVVVGANTVQRERVEVTGTAAAAIADVVNTALAGTEYGLVVRAIVKEVPDATSTFAPSSSTSVAYESSRIVKASAGQLFSITGYNSKTTSQFIQVHNTTTVPAETAVPVVIFVAQASSNFSYSADKFGRFFSTGITVVNSSTGPTKTIGAADCWFDVLYS